MKLKNDISYTIENGEFPISKVRSFFFVKKFAFQSEMTVFSYKNNLVWPLRRTLNKMIPLSVSRTDWWAFRKEPDYSTFDFKDWNYDGQKITKYFMLGGLDGGEFNKIWSN